MTALAVGLAVFALAVAAISVLTRRLRDPASQGLRTVRGLTAAAVLVSGSALAVAYTGGRVASPPWVQVQNIGILGVITVGTAALVAWLWFGQYGEQGRRLVASSDPTHLIARWLAPVESVHGLVKAFALNVLLPFVLVQLGRWAIGDGGQPTLPAEVLATKLLNEAARAPLWEEGVFRWLPVFGFGLGWQPRRTLFVLTLAWILFHLIRWLIEGTSAPSIVLVLLGLCVSSVFYYRVWRGPYFWTAFLVHSGWNAGVIFVSNYLRVP